MIRRILTVLILLIIPASLLAQSSVLEAALQKRSQAEEARELNITLQLNENIKSGLAFQWPGDVIAIPFAVKLNGDTLWLKNTAGQPKSVEVVHWQQTEQSIVLYFMENLLTNGDRLELNCAPHLPRQVGPDEQITVSALVIQIDGSSQAGNMLVSKPFPVTGE